MKSLDELDDDMLGNLELDILGDNLVSRLQSLLRFSYVVKLGAHRAWPSKRNLGSRMKVDVLWLYTKQ
jgi:hypothetical protein